MARKRRKSYIPEGAIIQPDGSWYYKFTEEEREQLPTLILDGHLFGKQIGFGELICTAE